MSFDDIKFDVEDGVAAVTLNRPEKLNALSWNSWAEIESTVSEATVRDDVRVILFKAEGRAFSAGSDLSGPQVERRERPFPGRAGLYRSTYLAPAQIYNCPKPTIAAVNGVAVGAGLSLALACDIRIAGEAARFSAIFVKRALCADTGTTWLLPRLIGDERALEMLYTGRMVDANEAQRIGLVSKVVADSELLPAAADLANRLATGPSLAIELDKQLVRGAAGRSLEDHILIEQLQQGVNHRSEDVIEGRNSFLEKREPRFRGR